MKPKVFVVSFSDLSVDGRVLRQIKALAPHFDLTVAGLDSDPSPQLPGVTFRFVALKRCRKTAGKIFRNLTYPAGWIFPAADFWPWSTTSEYRMARAALFSEPFSLVLCNDLNATLLGVEALRRKGIPFVADYHEFPSGEATERLAHRYLWEPHGHRCLKRYGRLAAGSMTVNQCFADEFRSRYGFPAIVVLNAPELKPLTPQKAPDNGGVHLIYHGVGAPNRNVEMMIRAMSKTDRDFTLHLMLITSPEFLEYLKREAAEHAPGKVVFEEPVPPAEIAARISAFDVGLFVVHNHSFNNRSALPNKIFEYVHGGLALCCSKSPAMEKFIGDESNGWLIDDVSSEALADCLSTITAEELAAKKAASLQAREKFHAGIETSKMVKMLTGIVSGRVPASSPASASTISA
jgi:glycosyltransferase involved in cell wall biosynthesis